MGKITGQLVDRIPVKGKMSKDVRGYLHIKGVLVAKESVLDYSIYEMPDTVRTELPDGMAVVRVFRSADALKKNLKDYNGMPFTDEHPWDGPITAKDRGPVCGIADGAKKSPKGVKVDLTVFDSACIIDIETETRREVSLGYKAEFDITPGVHDGKPYDISLSDIVPNHTALTARGRCGPDCAITDCKTCSTNVKPTGDKSMNDVVKTKTVAFNDTAIIIAAESESALSTLVGGLKDSNKDMATQLEKVTGERDALQQQLTDHQTKFNDENVQKLITDAAKLRAGIIAKAAPYLGDAKLEDLSNKQLMLDALKAAGIEGLDDKSDAHIEGAFTVMPKKEVKKSNNVGDSFSRNSGNKGKGDANDSTPDDDLAAARKKYRNGGKG